MATINAGALQSSATDLSAEQKRIVRALTECMTALEIAPDLYTVIGENQGPEYTVDTRVGRCTCPDAKYRREEDQACKHELRVRFATRELEIPDWIDEEDVDPLLGQHVAPTETDGGTHTLPNVNRGRGEEESLELVDTGGGWLVFEQLTEERDTRTVVAKRLLGFYHVTDWDEVQEAVENRGHGTGAVLNLPEFETIADAQAAANRGMTV